MILLDVNLLVYAHMATLPQHEAARSWLDARLNESTRVALPWPTLLGFMRVSTNAKVFQRPQSVMGAWAQVESWLDRSNVWVPEAGQQHRRITSELVPRLGGQHRLISDAHLAALAMEHGLTLCSTDADFARLTSRGLKWINPLED